MTIMKIRTLEIITHLKKGKSQWELYKMGYPLGTIRYHHKKMFRPEQFEKFMTVHKERMRNLYKRKKQNLST